MPIKSRRCPACGQTVEEGRSHQCPAAHPVGVPQESITETVAETGCALGEMGCCLADLLSGCGMGCGLLGLLGLLSGGLVFTWFHGR